MTCNHCNGEHPDDFKFCPVTGREMVQALLACTNEGCLDFGKAVLPVEAKFCPRCGQMLAVENLSQESGVTVFRVNGVEFEMIHVEGGSFDMGSDDGDAYEDEMPVHRVALSSYRMGKYPVTQELWKAVMGNNPSYFEGPHRPVENVSWNDCQKFIRKLNHLAGEKFKLPTWAQWEFAARGGNDSRGYKYYGSNDKDEVAWHGDNNHGGTHDVGELLPNELGLYDMTGNVSELCSDCFVDDSSREPFQVCLGGGWDSNLWPWPSRICCTPDQCDYSIGFRLCL